MMVGLTSAVPAAGGRGTPVRPWRTALLHALPLSLAVLSLFAYWFGVANRYLVFLYEHLGAGPFDEVTVSRYWMAGLVAGGVVLALYVPACALCGRLWGVRPPGWWRV